MFETLYTAILGNEIQPQDPSIQTFSTTIEPVIISTTNYNVTSPESSTFAPIPNRCTSEGFAVDPVNCRKFYRCVSNGLQGYTQYEFTCAPGKLQNIKLVRYSVRM